MNRDEHLERLRRRAKPWDLVIVGGGATGLGAALDAASRGHSVALIEGHDFAKGTSSRSTKLIHGGVRYLKQGNLSLVRQALRERALLLQNAPHLTHTLDFVIPCYHWSDLPFYGAGLKLYDALAGSAGLAGTRFLSPDAVRERVPAIASRGLKGGILYQDGQFDDAALALAIARTAAAHGATLVNYLRCVSLLKTNGRVTGVMARDMERGEEMEIRAEVVLNATGVFADELRRQDETDAPRMIRTSQGAHIVLERAFLPGETALMIPKTSDGRVLFAVPWQDRVVVGTTDTPVTDIPLEPRPLEEEIDFILAHAAHYLRRAPKREDVLSVFAGLRPLVSRRAARTASLSRDHVIDLSRSGLITITGGKWTTYRHMAEEAITAAEQFLTPRTCRTRTLGLDDDLASAVERLAQSNPGFHEPVHSQLPYRHADVVWAVRETMARTIEDVLARRTRALILNAMASIEAAPTVAALMARELGWSDLQQQAHLDQYRTIANGYLTSRKAD